MMYTYHIKLCLATILYLQWIGNIKLRLGILEQDECLMGLFRNRILLRR